MRCTCCNLRLESFDDLDFCKNCIRASEDDKTLFVDPQQLLITNVKEGCVYTPVRKGSE